MIVRAIGMFLAYLLATPMSWGQEATALLVWLDDNHKDETPSFLNSHPQFRLEHSTLVAFAKLIHENPPPDTSEWKTKPYETLAKYPLSSWKDSDKENPVNWLANFALAQPQDPESWKRLSRTLLENLRQSRIPGYAKLERVLEQPSIIERYSRLSLASLRALVIECGLDYYHSEFCQKTLGEWD